jgi:hypothetical protein
MKSKLLTVTTTSVIIVIIFSGCSNSQSSNVKSYTSDKTTRNQLNQSTITRSNINNTGNNSNVDMVTTKETVKDYSSYTGDWVCKQKATSIKITVDSFGNVEGSITTVVNSHVPSSLIKGTIKNDVLTSKLLVDETGIGTIILSFTEPEVLIGNVKLVDNEVEYWTLEQGEMRFIKYSSEGFSSSYEK